MNPDAKEILEWVVKAFDAGHLTIKPEANNGFIGRARIAIAQDAVWEDVTVRQLADRIFESLTDQFYTTLAQGCVDKAWARERANNIAQGLLFHKVK